MKKMGLNKKLKHKKILITVNGVTKTIPQWSKKTGITIRALYSRFYRGWKEKDMLIPKKIIKKYSIVWKNGETETKTIAEWSKEKDIEASTLTNRLSRGVPLSIALTKGRLSKKNGYYKKKVIDTLDVESRKELDRDEKIKWLRDKGCTYEEIGDFFGITRQRVHQIVHNL